MKLRTKLVLGTTLVVGLSVSAFAACAADVYMGDKQLKNVADGTDDGDAVNVGQLNVAIGVGSRKSALSGDSVTGAKTGYTANDVLGATQPMGTACQSHKTYNEAVLKAIEVGGRLPTETEYLTDNVANGTGCNFDLSFVWTATGCGTGQHIVAKIDGTTMCMDDTNATIDVRFVYDK